MASFGDPIHSEEAGTSSIDAKRNIKLVSGASSGVKDPIVRSAVMHEFEAEAPRLAPGVHIQTNQFPIPEEWNNPEVSVDVFLCSFLYVTVLYLQ